MRAPTLRPRDLGFRPYILRVLARTIVQISLIRSIVESLANPLLRSVIAERGVEVLKSPRKPTELDFFGGVAGGFSVSSGVPPAHAVAGPNAFPGAWKFQTPGSAVSAMSKAADSVIRRERSRRPMSASPSDGGPEGGRDHDATSGGLGAKGGLARRAFVRIAHSGGRFNDGDVTPPLYWGGAPGERGLRPRAAASWGRPAGRPPAGGSGRSGRGARGAGPSTSGRPRRAP